ncbi:MAG: decaprenylphospho-beta-D-erythro-pentofuranosid-2-ulose 2-reductase [Actinobacteria bacterium]|nr:decaprenylphospho-beta-D-erythro-pentofuranosid-2-ulose 2-reductase [Actinomycetota bacterium]MCL6105157.1 decaprenylphospho-beta-D-erythro-pentofuranosid-2-ulose 2-reductase [Actinomycetota bacterium]
MKDSFGYPQSVLVLGGSSDIAGATLIELVKQRCRTVVLAGRNRDAMGSLATELHSFGATVVDLVDFDAVDVKTHEQIISNIFTKYKNIDLVLIAFGILGNQNEGEEDPLKAVCVAETNFTGAVSTCLWTVKYFKHQGYGTLVVLSSLAAERVRKNNFIYGATKAGLDGFAQGLGDSLVGSGIKVMIVRPGFVLTKMTKGTKSAPMPVTPDVVARSIVKGLELGKEIVWIPPFMRIVMSLVRHLPRPIFRQIKI